MPQDTHPSEKEEKTSHVIDLNKSHYKHLKEEDENSDSSAPSTPEITKKKPMQARNTPVRSPASFRVPLGENRETSSREEWAKFVREHQRRRKKEKQEFQNNLPKATLRFLKKQVRTVEMFVSVIFLLFFVSTFIASSFKKVRLADSELYHWAILGCTLIWGFFIIKFFTKRAIKLSKRFRFFETYVYYFIHSSYRSISILILASIIFPFWQYFIPNITNKEVIKYINLTFVVIIVLCATNLIRAIGTKLLTGMANKTHFHEQIVNALFNERMLVNLLLPKKRTNVPKKKKKKLFSMKDLFGDVELRKFHSMSRLVQRRSFVALGEELSSWDEITSTERAQELAGKVFQNIDRKNKGYITKQDITNFVKPKYINKVFSVFDVDQDGKVVREEVEELVIRIYRERNALSNGLKDRENMGLVLTRIVKLVFWFVMFFVSLQIYGFPIMNWITPLAAFFVGFGFIFGESLKETFSSIILIFAIHPYDVGDRVTINKGQIFIVESIYLLTTQFFTLEGKLVIMKNSTMAANQIENHKRSIIATHHMDLQIEFGTPMEKIVALRNVISHFLAARPKLWKPEFYFWISDLANSNRINILFWCTTRYIWQEGPTNWQLKTELYLHVKSKMTELGITYYSPPQNLFIRTSPEEREFISQLLI